MEDGSPDTDGDLISCNVDQSDTEGCSEGWPLGILDNKGFNEGCLLG